MASSRILNSSRYLRFNSFFHKQNVLIKSIRNEVLWSYISFFLISLVLVTLYNKKTLHLFMNQYHSPFFDAFFKYTTFLGDGALFGVLFLVFLFFNKRTMWAMAVGGLLTLLTTHFFKKLIFHGLPRPAGDFGIENLHIVEGVKMAFSNTFPSGHTMTAFTIATILCLSYRKCKSQYIWLFLALVAGISRVYLSQHYWVDIFVGSSLGVILGFVSMGLFHKVKTIH